MKKAIFKFICSLLIVVLAGLFVQNSEAAFDDNAFLELCKTGTLKEVEDAIKAGANVNAKTQFGVTALMLAAQNHRDHDVVATLINNGADINAGDQSGFAALGRAVVSNNLKAITALIKAGVDVNARDKGGDTVLIDAAVFNKPEAADTLIKNRADINARDRNGKTALMIAAQYNINSNTITVLIKNGANVELEDNSGLRAIDYAKMNERLKNTNAFKESKDGSKWGIAIKPWMFFALIMFLAITVVIKTIMLGSSRS